MEWLTVCLAEGMGEEQTVVSLHCAMEFVGSRIVVSLAVASQWWLHNTVECGARFRLFCDKLHLLVDTHSS